MPNLQLHPRLHPDARRVHRGCRVVRGEDRGGPRLRAGLHRGLQRARLSRQPGVKIPTRRANRRGHLAGPRRQAHQHRVRPIRVQDPGSRQPGDRDLLDRARASLCPGTQPVPPRSQGGDHRRPRRSDQHRQLNPVLSHPGRPRHLQEEGVPARRPGI